MEGTGSPRGRELRGRRRHKYSLWKRQEPLPRHLGAMQTRGTCLVTSDPPGFSCICVWSLNSCTLPEVWVTCPRTLPWLYPEALRMCVLFPPCHKLPILEDPGDRLREGWRDPLCPPSPALPRSWGSLLQNLEFSPVKGKAPNALSICLRSSEQKACPLLALAQGNNIRAKVCYG